MGKKIDINKLLSTGSAKQRAVLLFYHYNLKEAIDKGLTALQGKHILPLTDAEAKALFDSIKGPKDIKVYNDYRALNIDIIEAMKWLINLLKSFETEYWKYTALYLESKYVIKAKYTYLKEKYTDALEDRLIDSYSTALEYYTALKIYIKQSGYRDKFIIEQVNLLYEDLKRNLDYPTLIGDKEIRQDLSNIEPDEKEVKKVLKRDFNLEYETEE